MGKFPASSSAGPDPSISLYESVAAPGPLVLPHAGPGLLCGTSGSIWSQGINNQVAFHASHFLFPSRLFYQG